MGALDREAEGEVVRILHISDLHASETEDFGQSRVAAAFVDDLRAQQEATPIDIVVFSGDLAFAGADAEFALGYSILLEPALRCVGLGPERLVIVPGNHDVDRTLINPYEDLGLRQTLVDQDSTKALLTEPRQLRSAVTRLDGWQAFVDGLSAMGSSTCHGGLGKSQTYDIRGVSVGVAALNSAWRSGTDQDDRTLLVGEYQLVSTLSAIRACHVRLVVAHHPLEWLTHFDESAARRALETERLLYLCGHEHTADPSIERRRGAGVVYSRAGCLYESPGFLNAYSLISVDSASGKIGVQVRSWWPERGEFDVATNVARNGVFTFEFGSPALTHISHPPFNLVRQALVDVAPAPSRLPERSDHLPAVLDEMLVEPRFLPLRYEDAIAAKRADEDITVDAIEPWSADWADVRVVIVGGGHGAGITSAVLWLLDARYKSDATLFPVFIQHDQRFSQRGIAQALERAARAAGWSHDLPALLMGVDDVTPVGRGLDQLSRFLIENPRHRAVFGCNDNDAAAIGTKLEAAGLSCVRAFVGPFGVRQLRSLIDQICGSASDEILQMVFAVVHSQELPRTPFILAALVVVVVSLGSADATEVNPSTLLQSYVSLLLGRDDLEDREQLAMDYRRREHLLGSFAAELVRTDTETMSRLDAEGYLGTWFRTKGWGPTSSPGDVLNSLIARRILTQDRLGQVGFVQPALRHLFTAKWMQEDPEFREQVLLDPMKYADAISHAAALVRSSNRYLTVTVEQVQLALAQLAGKVEPGLFSALEGQAGWARFSPSAKRLAESLAQADEPEAEPDQEKRDEEFDAYTEELEARAESDVSPSAPEDVLLAALGLATWVLRSSELVDDVQLKVEALETAIKGWSLIAGIVATSELEEFTRAYLETHQADDGEGLTADDLDRLARLMMVLRLLVTVEWQLGTVHLSAVIDELSRDAGFMADSAQAMFLTVLYWHLHGSDSVTRLRHLYEQNRDHPIVTNMVRAIAHWTYDHESNQRLRQQWEGLLVDIYSDAEPTTGRERAAQRDALASQLRRLRLKRVARRSGGPDQRLDELDRPVAAEDGEDVSSDER